MGCRASLPIVPESSESTDTSVNNNNYNKEYYNDSIIYEEPIVSSFTNLENIKYNTFNSLERRNITDHDSDNDEYYLIEKAERILRNYKKIIKYIIKNEKIDVYIYAYEKRLVQDWLSTSKFLLDNIKYSNEFNRYNMKYNLLLNHFNSLYKIIEKQESRDSGE